MPNPDRVKLLDEATVIDRSGPKELAFLRSRLSAAAPRELYHYTTDAGLYGIMQSGRLRISDVFTMNDPSEIQYGYDVFFRRARDHRDKAGDGSFADFIGGLESFQQHVAGGPVTDVLDYFCASFSTHSADDLAQWRSYGANGRGYCMVFDGNRLQSAFQQFGDPGFQHVFAVSYDPKELIEVYDEILARIHDLWVRFGAVPESDGGDGELWRRLRIRLSNCLHESMIRLARYFKHPAYGPEQEYRFGLRVKDGGSVGKCHTQPRADRMVRYHDFDWTTVGKEALKQVFIGPAAVPHAEKFVYDCIREFGYPSVRVERSTIPYRVY